MVVHVFTANRYHLVPLISKGFATVYRNDANHVFLFYGTSNTDFEEYSNTLQSIGFSDFYFCSSRKSFIRFLRKYRHSSLLFHAGSYSWFILAFLCGCHSVNWVCWGSGAQKNKNKASIMAFPLKKFLYRRLYTIVTLMDDDRESLVRDFSVPSNRVFTISYMSLGDSITEYDILSYSLLHDRKNEVFGKPLILLGNNPSCIRYYMQMLHVLAKFKGQIIIHCRLNYSLNKNRSYDELCRLGTLLFSSDFYCDEVFYSDRSDYIRYMNGCDIYICGNEKQSGLGAIETCLKLGKKVFITGKNLNWIRKEFNATVFDAQKIDSLSYNVFTEPLSLEQQEFNYQASINRRSKHTKAWREYLHQLNVL